MATLVLLGPAPLQECLPVFQTLRLSSAMDASLDRNSIIALIEGHTATTCSATTVHWATIVPPALLAATDIRAPLELSSP